MECFAEVGIRWTPMVHVRLRVSRCLRPVWLKLEGAHPSGSLKYRTALALLHSLEKSGKLRAGDTVVESTSGNLGVALAMICRDRGYRFHAVTDCKATSENVLRMTELGAEVEIIDTPDHHGSYLTARLARVRALIANSRNFVWTNQYANEANPAIHAATTGPEIFWQMEGNLDAIFVPVSTGGTLAGIARFLRKLSPRTKIIAVDACGSVVFGGIPRPYKLTGIGSSRRSSFLSPALLDGYLQVHDQEAFALCCQLAAATGIKVGGSSGAALAACASHLVKDPRLSRVVCFCPDTGDNYQSSIFNDAWFDPKAQKAGPNVVEAITREPA